jgi:hypothetical protein
MPNYWGIKPLNHHFWEFCFLELMEDINGNLFMPLSTNSDTFQSLKKLVSKFDDFVCPQLYYMEYHPRLQALDIDGIHA